MKKGLVLINDLGDTWEQHTGQPIPLGGIVMRRDLDHALMVKVNRIIRRSLQFAFDRYPDIPDFVRQHAQEMEETVMRSHIDLYVNAYSLDLGKEGRAAIWKLLEISSAFHPEPIAGSFEVFL
jgi:1,4-dihydroxy-6-naphthoate synthase